MGAFRVWGLGFRAGFEAKIWSDEESHGEEHCTSNGDLICVGVCIGLFIIRTQGFEGWHVGPNMCPYYQPHHGNVRKYMHKPCKYI